MVNFKISRNVYLGASAIKLKFGNASNVTGEGSLIQTTMLSDSDVFYTHVITNVAPSLSTLVQTTMLSDTDVFYTHVITGGAEPVQGANGYFIFTSSANSEMLPLL